MRVRIILLLITIVGASPMLMRDMAVAARAHVGMSKFAYDLKTGAGTDASKNFFSVDGGGRRFDMIDYRTGTDGNDVELGAALVFEPVEVVLPMVAGQTGNVDDFKQVLSSWSAGNGEPWTSTLTLQDREGQPVRDIVHHDNVPCTLELPGVDSEDRKGVPAISLRMQPGDVTIGPSGSGAGDEPIANFRKSAAVASSFSFVLDGVDYAVAQVTPGEVLFAPCAQLPSAPGGSGLAVFYAPWSVSRATPEDDTRWADLFKRFADDPSSPRITASLVYRNKSGEPVLTVNLFNIAPIHYESSDLSLERKSQTGTETITLAVGRATYQ